MSNLQIGREYLMLAERKMQAAMSGKTPGEAAALVLKEYQKLSSREERNALVAVLATNLAVVKYRIEVGS